MKMVDPTRLKRSMLPFEYTAKSLPAAWHQAMACMPQSLMTLVLSKVVMLWSAVLYE